MPTELDLGYVDEVVDRLGGGTDQALPILQELQSHYRYLPEPALERVCRLTDIDPATLTGVSTFYAQFRHRPMGRHHIRVCNGTACHIRGAELVHEALSDHLGLGPGEDTDADRRFTLEKVFCVGCCTLAPVVQIDDQTHGQLTRQSAPVLIEDFLESQNRSRRRRRPRPLPTPTQPAGEVRLCLDSCCIARGCGETQEALRQTIQRRKLPITIKRVGCVVMCDRTPMVEFALPDKPMLQLSGIAPEQVEPTLLRHFRPQGLWPRLRSTAAQAFDQLAGRRAMPALPELEPPPPVTSFFSRQTHIATEHYGRLDPLDLDDYLAHGGFAGLRKCLGGMTPGEVITEVEISGLRGRGGAGYPTANKWRRVSETVSDQCYVICNGDEGDPGAFMDRMLMESFPFRVIEGMAIAAYAVGANHGYLYVRAEYPAAVERLREALKSCRERGFLGEDILGSGVSLDLEVFEGAGAFVCGEETAMLESMEGRRGIPRLKPPYPAEQGLHGRPTLINNVETFANLPWILRHGASAFSIIGTEKSKGTKVFALAGKVARGGLIEVPMGLTIREIVEDIGGGTPDGSPFKAVLVGGPSGGCVPAELADTPIDYESLSDAGAIMGSGGLVVLDQQDCMVAVARYFLDFCQCESCGKCTFCRVGTRRMLDILDRLTTGKAKRRELDELLELSEMVTRASLCGLGRTAPNPVLTALRHFRDEFEAHLEGRCPAGKCRELIRYSVTADCIGCTLCAQRCPADAIPSTPYHRHHIDDDLCTRCNSCLEACPENAITIKDRATPSRTERSPAPGIP